MKHTLFDLTYERTAMLPISFTVETYPAQPIDENNFQETLQQRAYTLLTATHIEHSQAQQKEWHDDKLPSVTNKFKIGNKVLLHRTKAKKQWNGKFENKWDGLFFIHEVLGNGSYKLRLDDKILAKVAHGDHLKHYHSRNNPEPLISQIGTHSLLKLYWKDVYKRQLKYFNNGQGIKPKKAHEIDTVYDLRYPGKDTLVLKPKSLTKINLKIALEIPPGAMVQITSRSSLASKEINVKGGIINAEYTGDITVMFQNETDKPFKIEHAEKIAQAIYLPLINISDGLFFIHEVLGNGSYKLRLDDKILAKVVHGDCLKHYHSRNNPEPLISQIGTHSLLVSPEDIPQNLKPIVVIEQPSNLNT
ncbi:hypothetical protein G9A89_018329 [Geosiphon pyriformis]|nr:hypothetical protein G9A89_018329 [Geosiphon pyriformis]